MMNFEFQNPWFLLLLIILPFFILKKYQKNKNKKSFLKISSLKPFGGSQSSLSRYKPLLFMMKIAGLSLCIISLARPQKVSISTQVNTEEGIDVLLTVDISLSMLAKDLEPNRLEALKKVAIKFAKIRITDRIGLVEYSGEAFTRVPLTTDRDILVSEIENLKCGSLADGTAIGVGLATAVNHLKDSKAKSKVVILLTDGVESIDPKNNLVYISPKQAADIALEKGIKVYTIGIGTNGMAPFPVAYDMSGNYIFDMQPVEIDEELMQEIANKTGGLYFRATSNESLEKIYKEIDKLEKSEINEIKYYNYHELFSLFLFPALILLLLEMILKKTLFKELT